MIKKLLLTMGCLVLFFIINAQSRVIELGFHGGVQTSLVKNSYSETLLGYNAGLQIRKMTGDHFGIKVLLESGQVNWVYRSYTFEIASGTGMGLGQGDLFYKLNYLDMPIVAEYTFGERTRFYVDGGLFVGALVNSRAHYKLNDISTGNNVNAVGDPGYKKINYGVSLGAGVQVPITSRLTFDIGLRDKLGVANIYKQTYAGSSLKLNVLSISAGVSFPI